MGLNLYNLLIYQYYKCIEILNFATYWCIAGLKKGAIPAAHLYHALYRELPARVSNEPKHTIVAFDS